MKDVEVINDGDTILAIIIRSGFNKEGLTFVSPENFPLQLGVHIHKKGFSVGPHKHVPMYELKILAQEVFHIQEGKIKVGIYNKKDQKFADVIVNKGDTILLSEGHSFDFLEDSKIFEVKQGPYRGKEIEKIYLPSLKKK